MAKLPKWAIKQAGGINKKAWALARGRKSKAKRGKKTMAKKTKRRSTKGKILTKPFYDGLMSAGGKIVLRKLGIEHQLLDAGIDGAIGFIRNNKTLQAQAVAEGITALIPNIGATGSITSGWEE